MSLLLFFISFAVYLYAMPGTIPVYRDSGDLISAISTLGIAHPPGYPFYVLLGKLEGIFLPWATPAYRANLLSVFAAACTVGLLSHFLNTFFRSHKISSATLHSTILAIAYAMSPAVWSLARTSEMYALESTFAMLILCFCALPGKEHVRLAAFLLGLGLAVHPTLLFLAPLVAVVVWDASRKDRSVVPQSLLVFALGISVFLYLPLRGRMSPLLVWGDPSSWRGFWRLVTRADYGGLKLHPVQSEFVWTPQSLLMQLQFFVRQSCSQGGVAGAGLAAAGLIAASIAPQSDRRSVGLSLSFLLAGPLFFILSNLPLAEATTPAILEPYMVLVNLLALVLIAYGALWLFRRGAPGWGMAAVIALMVFTKPIEATPYMSARHHYYAYDYGRNLLHSLPPSAVLYDPDDPTAFTLRALQLTEHRREDVALLNFFRTGWGYQQIRQRWPDLLLPGPINSAQELEQMFWTYSIHRRPFYAELPQKVPAPLFTRPEGLVYRIFPSGESHPPMDPTSTQLFSFYVQRGDFRTTAFDDFFTRHLLGYYAAAYSNLGLAFANEHQPDAARMQYRQALIIDPELSAAYNNLGILEYQEGRYAEAIRWYSIALSFSPNDQQLLQNRQLAQDKR